MTALAALLTLSPLEVAIYALVLMAEPAPFTCVPDGVGGVNCTNGMAAVPVDVHTIRFRHGVTVFKNERGELWFSNGITTHFDSFGWVQFSNGVSVRRDGRSRFRFNTGMVCTLAEPDLASCEQPK